MKVNLPYIIIILALVFIIVFQRSCVKPEIIEKPTITVVSDTEYVTKDSIITQYVPKEIKVEIPIEVPTNVDTQAILKDYYSKRIYLDTIKLDSFGYVSILDTISENKVISRSPYYNYTIPIITNTITIDNPPKRVFKAFAGLETGILLRGTINSIGPQIILNTKRDQIYNIGGGYNFNSNSPYIKLGAAWKVKIK